MGFMDRIKGLRKHAEAHGDKIADTVDKATDAVDDKTGGKFSQHLDKVDDAADELRDDDQPEAPAASDTTDPAAPTEPPEQTS